MCLFGVGVCLRASGPDTHAPNRPPLGQIERIRTLSECAARLAACSDPGGGRWLAQRMSAELLGLPLDQALPVLRAYGHYLK